MTFAMPDGPAIALDVAPRLESWEARTHPNQIMLADWLWYLRERIHPLIARAAGDVAVRLDVGLPDHVDPLWERDLDNYLYPLARELPSEVVSVWGTKARGQVSYVRVETARVDEAIAEDWVRYYVPRAPGAEASWKRTVRAALVDAAQLPDGPVALQITLAVGSKRNWTRTWKGTIDGLEPILGRTYPGRDWNPLDGRIVRIGLHRRSVPTLGDDVEAMIWARSANDDWPEMKWLATMSPLDRAAFWETHRATVERAAGLRVSRSPRSAAVRKRSVLRDGLSYLDSVAAFSNAKGEDVSILIVDSARRPRLHEQSRHCAGVTIGNFERKVIAGGGRNGGYIRVDNVAAALREWPQLQRCKACARIR